MYNWQLIKMANANSAELAGRSPAEVIPVLDRFDVVVAVWTEASMIGRHAVKGAARLQRFESDGVGADLTITALHVRTRAEALALELAFSRHRRKR